MKQLILINAFFAALLLFFVLMPVTSNWLWFALIFVWCWVEGIVAKSASVKWWHMLLVFILLGTIDIVILYTFTS
jgi:hypothetical protein